jgi:hypothetical protein
MKYSNFSQFAEDLSKIGLRIRETAADETTRKLTYGFMVQAFGGYLKGMVTKGDDVLPAPYERGSNGGVDALLGILDRTVEVARDFEEYVVSDRCKRKMSEVEDALAILLEGNRADVEGFKKKNREPLSPSAVRLDAEDDHSPMQN